MIWPLQSSPNAKWKTKHLQNVLLFILVSPFSPHKDSTLSRRTHSNTHSHGCPVWTLPHPPAQYLGSICWVLCLSVLRGPLDRGPCPPASSAYLWPEPTGQGWRMGPRSWGQARERVREGLGRKRRGVDALSPGQLEGKSVCDLCLCVGGQT